MYPIRYFPARYYAERYWPKGAGVVVAYSGPTKFVAVVGVAPGYPVGSTVTVSPGYPAGYRVRDI